MKPLLEIFTIVWNEEKIIQDFIDWYRQRVPDCLITVYDNLSSDRTVEICKNNNCNVISYNTNGWMDEQTLINIRNVCWKNSEAEYVCVVDADEGIGLNREMLQKNLEDKDGWNIAKCQGYEMFGTETDTIDQLLFGCWSAGYCKPVLFRPEFFDAVNLHAGSHSADPVPYPQFEIKWLMNAPNLYHFKWRSWTNGIERAHLLAKRRSPDSARKGWNIHYQFEDSIHKDYYNNGLTNRIKVR